MSRSAVNNVILVDFDDEQLPLTAAQQANLITA